MNKVFSVELSNGCGKFCNLNLPAPDYVMLDTLERLKMDTGNKLNWEMIENTNYIFLNEHLTNEYDLFQLNALAGRLDQMDSVAQVAFEGLVRLKVEKGDCPISPETMFNLAYSTDCCHVIGEISDDAQLGRFYADNDFVPELEGISERVFELLDFKKLGAEMRTKEGGVLTRGGYVVQHSELKQVESSLCFLPPQVPNYMILLQLSSGERSTKLFLPASPQEMDDALDHIGADNWSDATIKCMDCVVPSFIPAIDQVISVAEVNRFAYYLLNLSSDDLLKFKAVLSAADSCEIAEAIEIIDSLDDYLFEPDTRSVEDAARHELKFAVDARALAILLPHVNLYPYGHAVLDELNSVITEYGLVERVDAQPIQAPERPKGGEMKMM